jgi:hypothetical protein
VRWTGALVIGIAGAASATMALALVAANGDLAATFQAFPLATIAMIATPLASALVAAAFVAALSGGAPAPRTASTASVADDGARAKPKTPPPSDDAALHLLALLQQEGRFVDFLEENLTAYPDDQVGAAVRSIHEGCRAALRDRLELAPILAGDEGASVTVERGFDPAAIRVTGNVRGEPPYRGVLRHAGWRTTSIRLPARTGAHDASILAPAEVEIP